MNPSGKPRERGWFGTVRSPRLLSYFCFDSTNISLPMELRCVASLRRNKRVKANVTYVDPLHCGTPELGRAGISSSDQKYERRDQFICENGKADRSIVVIRCGSGWFWPGLCPAAGDGARGCRSHGQ